LIENHVKAFAHVVGTEPLARAGAAAGVDGIFLEVHDNPEKALSDGSNALALGQFRALMEKIVALGALVRKWDA